MFLRKKGAVNSLLITKGCALEIPGRRIAKQRA
jgi:hypothetical protein